MAEQVGRRLRTALPTLRKTVVDKVALVVGAMIEVRTPNTAELANVLPLETERQDMREQWVATVAQKSLAVQPGAAEVVGVPGARQGELSQDRIELRPFYRRSSPNSALFSMAERGSCGPYFTAP